MSSPEPLICCPNSVCPSPLNLVGRQVCEACETPLIHRYLWAVGVADALPGEQIVNRYYVIAPQVWLETQPGLSPPIAFEALPDEGLPYLHLYPQRLHVPEVYGVISRDTAPILLLENVPLDGSGNLYPTIVDAWSQATTVRQVYWLWQILQLWQPLAELGVASSLLAADNLRVEGWRVRLKELLEDESASARDESTPSPPLLELKALGAGWGKWLATAKPTTLGSLLDLCDQMQKGVAFEAVEARLNEILVEQAAQLPLRLQVFGITETGPQRSHNEDACYPTPRTQLPDDLMPHLAIVCDGIGGHEGGEVASQLAVQTLKLQVRALLAELAEQTELVPPQLLANQLEASIRVVNNLIAAQNDAQGREARRRMGTTLMMALQLPQVVRTATGSALENAHELYLAHVGDSRAYWITQHYCHLLTLDDDVATREVRLGQSLYREALQRSDAGSLTQALGTRDAEFLRPTVQRFIIEEDGLLLLCSDGLSDNGWVEQAWVDSADSLFKGRLPLEAVAQAWVDLANQKNGYDNTSVVLLHCQVTPPPPPLQLPGEPLSRPIQESQLSEASKALLYGEAEQQEAAEPVVASSRTNRWSVLGILVLLLIAIGVGVVALRQLNPGSNLPSQSPSPDASSQSLPPKP